jgi:hypothetical protein
MFTVTYFDTDKGAMETKEFKYSWTADAFAEDRFLKTGFVSEVKGEPEPRKPFTKVKLFVGHVSDNAQGEFKVVLKSGDHRKEYDVKDSINTVITDAIAKIKDNVYIKLYTQDELPQQFRTSLYSHRYAISFHVHK